VLIARTWRDAGEHGRARAELAAALAREPGVARAHYYLGTIAIAEKGRAGLDEAIEAFRAELRASPRDVPTHLELGMALVDTQRYEDAIAPLELAAAAEPGDARTLYYLGRAQLGVGRAEPAAASLAKALERTRERGSAEQQRVIHNQLGQALRQLGRDDEAATHFAEAQRLSAQSSQSARDQLSRQEAEVQGEADALAGGAPLVELSPLAALGASERAELDRRVTDALARSHLNLGVMLARADRFARAAEQFQFAADVAPDFPQAQSSLGIAWFNARRYEAAGAALARALAADPGDADIKRMLAMARLNTQDYAGAAELLHGDPELERDASLRFAYGLALSRSGQTERAEEVFKTLLREGEQAELAVLLGKAHAQMGDFKEAIASFERAIALRPDVAEAQGALGVIYFKQGRLDEAEKALRAELARSAGDVQSRLNLAQVLESSQRPEEALPLLRDVLEARPDFADARYLLGKILLAQGATAEAIAQLEAATRLAPDEANAHYQLARAYTSLGRAEDAQREFEVFRQIKARR
jgi:tetratricopeptide (TPR) repeat protein